MRSNKNLQWRHHHRLRPQVTLSMSADRLIPVLHLAIALHYIQGSQQTKKTQAKMFELINDLLVYMH